MTAYCAVLQRAKKKVLISNVVGTKRRKKVFEKLLGLLICLLALIVAGPSYRVLLGFRQPLMALSLYNNSLT